MSVAHNIMNAYMGTFYNGKTRTYDQKGVDPYKDANMVQADLNETNELSPSFVKGKEIIPEGVDIPAVPEQGVSDQNYVLSVPNSESSDPIAWVTETEVPDLPSAPDRTAEAKDYVLSVPATDSADEVEWTVDA